MNIVLVGMPASGKTTVSKALGALTGREVADIDAEIVKSYGSISDIFAKHGEARFRELEAEVIASVSARDNLIISAGGGAVLRGENVENFKKNGKIIYLKAEISTLLNRVAGDSSRPLLNGGAEENLKRLYSERQPIYEGVSDFTVRTDGVAPEEIAIKITELLQ